MYILTQYQEVIYSSGFPLPGKDTKEPRGEMCESGYETGQTLYDWWLYQLSSTDLRILVLSENGFTSTLK